MASSVIDNSRPAAFLSYARADDEHDHGRITALRHRLEGEVRMHTGIDFIIFQDKRDISWGQNWQQRIDKTLLSVTFLIPIITPSFFKSSACRDEYDKFILREKQIGENSLILPIYYLEADEMENIRSLDPDEMAKVLSSRNWSDWRALRFKPLTSPEVESAVSEMAKTIKIARRNVEEVIVASATQPTAEPIQPPVKEDKDKIKSDLVNFRPQIPSIVETVSADKKKIISRLPYYAYTTSFDEIILAKGLSDQQEIKNLYKHLKSKVDKLRSLYRTKISQSCDALKAKNTDSVSVVLLIDNSGSMRGPRILEVAAWIDILSNILESVNIPHEILGFTTRAWKGGQSRERWLADGKPRSPGRLNDLRHIIYKEFDEEVSESNQSLGIMLREGLLKENVDGEALLWAFDRSGRYKAKKNVIITFTDGAPVDDSTMAANKGDFLTRHLRSTIIWLEHQPGIKVHGVGVEYDCAQYYRSNVFAEDLGALAEKILDVIPGWVGAD